MSYQMTERQEAIIEKFINGVEPQQIDLKGISLQTIYRELKKLRLIYKAPNNEKLREKLLLEFPPAS